MPAGPVAPSCHSRFDGEAAAAKEDLLVDRGDGARHYPGMAQKSTDEAWRPPGIEQSANPRFS